MSQIAEKMKRIMKTSSWKKSPPERYDEIYEELNLNLDKFSSLIFESHFHTKTEWVVEDFIVEENKIDLLWDELKIFLEDDEDFQISRIFNDSIKIKALNPMAFRKEYVYCKILSHIIPTNCKLELISSYHQAKTPEKDFLIFDLSIITENNLHYKGSIKIIK